MFFDGGLFGGEFFESSQSVGSGPFFGGPFFGGGFFGESQVEPQEEEAPTKTGGKGDNDRKKRKSIYKPTGLLERKTVEERVEATREIHREVLKLPPKPLPVAEMSLAQIEAEIGERLRVSLRTEEEEILMLLAAAVAG